MILEALTYLLTPCPAWARRTGLLRESVAIGARYRRQLRAWDPHLTQSKQAILDALGMADLGPEPRIAVIGSGHGFDLPLEVLSARAGAIDLVDAVHPWRMRRRARRKPMVRLVHADVTGRVGPDYTPAAPLDLIVSLNLISQLGVAFGGGESALREAHVVWLRQRARQVLIIGDSERRRQDGATGMILTDPLTPPALAGAPVQAEWVWPVAPAGEIAPDLAVETTVRVWRLDGSVRT
ncbi:MAG: hypothetical protein QNJ84_10205 [Alphaproteobacteria bacterium]|nr:hypothetical protein [Alphaproteobacteria bacterium]